jgi:ribonuclease HI
MWLKGHYIKSTTSVKLLGVYLDRELRWGQQGAAAVGKGQAWLAKVRRLARTSRGIKAGPMRRLYLATCVPRMLYAADVFLNPATARARTATNSAVIRKMRTVQRGAALLITGGLASSPTDALDACAGLPPIWHLVNKVRQRAALRLATLNTGHPLRATVVNAAKHYVKRHRTPLHELMDKFKIKPQKMEEIKSVRYGTDWEPSMAVSIRSSKEGAEEEHKNDKARWKIYTDGSGIDGKIGGAAVLYRDGVEVGASRKRLGTAKTHTVYEGEGIGGALGLGLLWRERDVVGEVTLAVDSTAAIRASQIPRPGPLPWIWGKWDSYARMILRKHLEAHITICWTPGHRGIAGNERADEEAKRAVQDGDAGKIPKSFRGPMPWSQSARLQKYNADIKAIVASEWAKSPR